MCPATSDVYRRKHLGAMLNFPRALRFGRWEISIYKVFVGVGIYLGVAICTIVAKKNGVAVGPMAFAVLACAVAGLVGARIYHLLIFRSLYRAQAWPNKLWSTSSGGGLFGGLIAIAVVSPAMATLAGLSFGMFWDYLSIALLVGAICTRCGCFLNGCCGGRETSSRFFALWWHDHRGEQKRRIPVQLFELGWLILAAGGLIYYFPHPHPAGAAALGVLAWYGLGRFILEPLRAEPDTVSHVRINQVVAGVLVICAAFLLLLLKK
jgi:phosphatidylglycerol:prolipoprotein diacylglycerol transferase